MSAFLARLILMISLLFGSVVVPAMAGAEAGHSMEIIDVDCSDLIAATNGDDEAPDRAPALHIDHHHCSACTALDGRSPPSGVLASSDIFFRRPATVLASDTAAPLTPPPAA